MLSKRPRSVGATTLLWGGQNGAGLRVLTGTRGFGVTLGCLQPPPHIPKQQHLLGPVQDGEQRPHQILHTTLVQVLWAQSRGQRRVPKTL